MVIVSKKLPSTRLSPDHWEEPLHSNSHGGPDGASESYLEDGEQPGEHHGVDGGGVGGDQGGEGEGDGHANNEERVKQGKHDENLSKSNLKLRGTI